MLRNYVGGRYQYREMKSPKWAIEREVNIDCLPPTMLAPVCWTTAHNMQDALDSIKAQVKASERNA